MADAAKQDDDAADAWLAELARRDANVNEETLVDAPDVHARARESLRARRRRGESPGDH